MQLFSRVLAFPLLFLFAALAKATDVEYLESIEDEEDVLVLTSKNFDQAVEAADTLLVEFYSPNCGHCKRAAPEYAKAASKLREHDPPVFVAKVDATVETKLAERYKIEGYPTFKFFKKDLENPKDYSGERTAESFIKWVNKYSGPLVKVIASTDELEDVKEANDVVLFTAIKSEEGEERDILESLASSEENVVFTASTSVKISEDCNVVKCMVIYKKFDEDKVVYDGAFEEKGIKAFLNLYKRPLVVKFSDETASVIFGGDVTTHILAFVDTSKDYYPNLKEKLTESAKANRDKIVHVVVESSEKRLVEYFGFEEKDFPSIILLSVQGALKKYFYSYRGEDLLAKVDTDLVSDLIAFQNDYFNGKLTPELKSADPVDDSEEHVKVIVGSQFHERVIDTDKDVLLEFYAPWCGHCKQLAPLYEQLGESFADVDSIMIAKMDATANEIEYEGVDVKGFPTIIFFPATDKKNPIVYDGSRDVEGFTDFLKKNARKFEHNGETFGVDHDEL